MDRKTGKEFLQLVQSASDFPDLPVHWILVKKGPAMSVSRAVTGEGVCARINIRGRTVVEVFSSVQRALVAANDMHKELTTASVVSSSKPLGEHVPKEYTPGPGDIEFRRGQIAVKVEQKLLGMRPLGWILIRENGEPIRS
jgi:hypothetical protein